MALIRAESDVKADIKRLNHKLRIYSLPELILLPDNEPINGFYFMPVQSGYGCSGIHDFVLCINDKMVTVETKAKHTGKPLGPSKLQKLFMSGITRSGGLSFVVDNVEDWEQCLRTHFPELF